MNLPPLNIVGGIFMRKLNIEELESTFVGEAITVGAVMAIMCAAIMAVVVYKLFLSSKGSANVPGGWKFSWQT